MQSVFLFGRNNYTYLQMTSQCLTVFIRSERGRGCERACERERDRQPHRETERGWVSDDRETRARGR